MSKIIFKTIVFFASIVVSMHCLADMDSAAAAIKVGDRATALHDYREVADDSNASDAVRGRAAYWLHLFDRSQAAYWAEKSYQFHDPAGMVAWGNVLLNGEFGIPKDELKAKIIFEEGISLGIVGAKVALGKMYILGTGVKLDVRGGTLLLQEAIKEGDALAMLVLADQLSMRFNDGVTTMLAGPKVRDEMMKTIGGADSYHQIALKLYREVASGKFYKYSASATLGEIYKDGFGAENGVPDLEKAITYFEIAAPVISNSAASLGDIYFYGGEGIQKDEKKGCEWYLKGAEAGDAASQAGIGRCLYFGQGVAKNEVTAAAWFQKSADAEISDGQFMLGLLYLYGDGGLQENAVTAASLMEKAAKMGHATANYFLGSLYKNGTGVTKNFERAVRYYRFAASLGNADAQYYLGLMYATGDGVPEDSAKAVEWVQKAAAQGLASAQHYLGLMYATGDGVPEDSTKAVEWFQQAAAQGDADAQNSLAGMYATGEGVPKDAAKAFEWFQKAAAQGHAYAQYMLGLAYASGDGVLKDVAKASEWYEKAAAQGHASAQNSLAGMYANGEGVPMDVAKAVELVQKAAAQGLASAQNNLGRMYANGEGVTRDRVRAYAWFNLATAQGYEFAKTELAKLETLISPEQRAEGQRLASNWKEGDTFKNIRNIPDAQTQTNKSTKSSDAVRWKPVGMSDSDAYFIDTQSIQKTEGLIYAWVKVHAVDSQKKDYKLNRWVVNCSNHTMVLISHISKDSSDKTTSNFDEKSSAWEYLSPPPDSVGDLLANVVCSLSANAAPSGESVNSTGSGFMVGGDYLLTNNHVVNGCTNLKIHDAAKLEHDVIVVATDAKSDLALLKTIKPVSLPAATFRANGSVESGESVVALGYPLAGVLATEVNVSFGYVSATAGLADDTSKLQISAPVQPGNSGGPLLDQSGNLIGVVVSKLDALKVAKAIGDIPQNINFAVKGEIAQVFLKAHKVKFKTAATAKKLENTDIARRGRAFTVLVECSQ